MPTLLLRCHAPVSYTHLDVYKRQVLQNAGSTYGGNSPPVHGPAWTMDIWPPRCFVSLQRMRHNAKGGACLLYTSRCV